MGKKGVLILSKTLSLTGIGACSENKKALNVKFIDPEDRGAVQCLKEVNPDVILLDLEDSPNDLDLRLLRKQPDLLLIGVDPSNDETLMFTRVNATE